MKRKTAVIGFFVLLGSLIFIKYTIFDIRRISGHSMEPALSDGQLVFIWKLAYGIPSFAANRYVCRWAAPEAGDVVLYYKDGRYVAKRCVKTEGEALEFVLNTYGTYGSYAALKLNDRDIPLSRVQLRNLGGFLPKDAQKVPSGFILAIGDNAAQSRDSRDYGFVAAVSICGKLLWN